MQKGKICLRALMLGIVIACLTFLIFSNPDTSGSHTLAEVMNCGHFPLFGVIALALFYYYEFGQTHGVKNYYLAWGIAVLLGILTELIQIFDPNRFFELRDLVYDALGAFTFLTFSFSFRVTVRCIRQIIRVGVALICIASTIPICLAVAEWESMLKLFPLISSFETHREVSRWEFHDAILLQVQDHATHGAYSAKVMLFSGKYPRISTDYFIFDWQGYQTLAFDIFLSGNKPLQLTILINDRAFNQAYIDCYHHTFTLRPGPNRVRIPLKNVAQAPRGRVMEMRSIALICIFAYQLDTPRTIFIDNVRLS